MGAAVHASIEATELASFKEALIKEQRRTTWRRIRGNRRLIWGAGVLLMLLACSIAVALLTSVDLNAVDPVNRLLPPGSREHMLGTDEFGRDLLLRVIAGARTSLLLGCSICILAISGGLAIGLLAGYFAPLDQLLMRVCDGLMAIPGILLALALATTLGTSIQSLVLALTVVFTPRVARVVRSRVLSVREETFIEACRSQGASHSRVLLLHIAPNVIPLLIVQFTLLFADAVLTEAAMSFLGAGVPPPGASLGNIIYDGKQVVFSTQWMVLIPSIVLVTIVLALNALGDGLDELFNPQALLRPPEIGIPWLQKLRRRRRGVTI